MATFTSNGITVTFEDNSDTIIAALKNAVERGLKAVGEVAEAHAKSNITSQGAVDTGRLRNSITYVVDGNDCYIGTNVEYAAYIEFGTGQYSTLGGGTSKQSWVYYGEDGQYHMAFPQKARPFLKPAASEHSNEYYNILLDSLQNA